MISQKFFDKDVETLARDLLGCELVHKAREGTTAGIIVETESYHQTDEASHSFNGETKRTAVMFGPPGHIYIYFTYGMHWCFNVTAEQEGVGAAVLIRALEPTAGIELMKQRRGFPAQTTHLDAVQGSKEERVNRIGNTKNERQTPADTAMRQEPAGAPSYAGQQGKVLRNLCSGPSKLVQAMGISREDYGKPLYKGDLFIKPRQMKKVAIACGPRVGISRAQDKPWRFWIKDSSFVSR
jgi:DNA-3-methyladenine glycosylase